MTRSLNELYEAIKADPKFDRLRAKPNVKFVPGSGPYPSPVAMLIGEAPGINETYQLTPFVGPAGQQLDRLLKKVQLDRDKVFITNALKYKARQNKDFQALEFEAARPYLMEEIQIIDPWYVVVLGKSALSTIYPDAAGTQLKDWRGVLVDDRYIVTYHPATLCYAEGTSRWHFYNNCLTEDFKRLQALIRTGRGSAESRGVS